MLAHQGVKIWDPGPRLLGFSLGLAKGLGSLMHETPQRQPCTSFFEVQKILRVRALALKCINLRQAGAKAALLANV